jgi:predicted lysophospholipase L1 biosynthesis ABC-type transport system permease subunit
VDRYEATWQMMVSYAYGLLVGTVVYLGLAVTLEAVIRASLPSLAAVPLFFIFAGAFIIGGAILGLPILLLAWTIVLAFFDPIHMRLKGWCITAPMIVGVLWLAFEYANFARTLTRFSWQTFAAGAGGRTALAMVCAAFASLHYYRRTKRLSAMRF